MKQYECPECLIRSIHPHCMNSKCMNIMPIKELKE